MTEIGLEMWSETEAEQLVVLQDHLHVDVVVSHIYVFTLFKG